MKVESLVTQSVDTPPKRRSCWLGQKIERLRQIRILERFKIVTQVWLWLSKLTPSSILAKIVYKDGHERSLFSVDSTFQEVWDLRSHPALPFLSLGMHFLQNWKGAPNIGY